MKGEDANLLFLTYNRQSVAQRQYHFLHPIICGNQIIEGFYPDGLQVRAMRLLTALITVDESKVESDVQPGNKFQSITYIELYLIGIG